jgi:hypothetical protein
MAVEAGREFDDAFAGPLLDRMSPVEIEEVGMAGSDGQMWRRHGRHCGSNGVQACRKGSAPQRLMAIDRAPPGEDNTEEGTEKP